MTGRRLVAVLLALVLAGSALSVVLAVTRPDASGIGVLPGSGPTYQAATLPGSGGEALEYAVTAVPLALSYDHRDLAGSLRQATSRMTRDYAAEFTAIFDDEVRPSARRRKAVTEARVRGAGVVRSRGDATAVCLVYVDQLLVSGTGVEAGGPPDVLSRSRVVVDLVRRDDGWRISGLRLL